MRTLASHGLTLLLLTALGDLSIAEPSTKPASKVEEKARDGRLQAKKDLAAGKLVVMEAGLPRPDYPIRARLLQEWYGIEVHNTGCIVTSESVSYQNAYNDVMMAEINRRFGPDVFVKASKEAYRQFEEAKASKKRS